MTAQTETHFAVLGTGAIGGLLAAQLAHAGESIVLWGRDPGIAEISERGLDVSGAVSLSTPVSTAKGALPAADLYLVTTKTPFNAELAQRMAQEIPAESRVLVCQNGLDPEQVFVSALGASRVLRAILYLGAKRLTPSHVEVSFWSRPTLIGGHHDLAGQGIAQRLDDLGHRAMSTLDIRRFAWEKVILNAVSNPLCALGGRTIAEAMTDRRFLPMLHEAMAVAAADGIELGADFEEQALSLLARTGEHRGSMWEDVRLGRPTEIDQLNARIVALGDRYGLPVETHREVVEALEGLAARRESP